MGLVQTYGHEPDPAVRLRKKWGARMKATRKTLGLTLEQLAAQMTDAERGFTVTAAAISQWERGAYTPRYHHQIRWCEVTGRRHDEVFDMTEAA
jgi:transcriptional regulator with XRE-family HTH domain